MCGGWKRSRVLVEDMRHVRTVMDNCINEVKIGRGGRGGGVGFVGALLLLLFASSFTWDGEERRIILHL